MREGQGSSCQFNIFLRADPTLSSSYLQAKAVVIQPFRSEWEEGRELTSRDVQSVSVWESGMGCVLG